MHRKIRSLLVAVALAVAAPQAFANVITDWDEKAVAAVTPMANLGGTSPYAAMRVLAMVHAAMFDAVNSIERRYKPYLAQESASVTTSKEAAAATAAATVLATIDEKTAAEMKLAVTAYLASIPDGAAKSDGIKLGEAAASKVLQVRADDGSDAPDAYRPLTTPGVYIPTAITLSSMWPDMKPFAMTRGSQFRPQPPIALDSKEWATDYNEIKEYGGRSGTRRTAQQTETAQFWINPLTGYQPFLRQIVFAKHMDVADGARFMALAVVALNDAIIAVLDAKYHYNFWRPITAIRNGDIDGNPATDRDATWQPIGSTPMHPEYPCSHCIQSGAVAGVINAVLGTEDIPEVALTYPTLPGVTHRFTNLTALTEEVANARIWAGFHYRFSTRVGTHMGREIGKYVVKNVMQPASVSERR